MTDIIRKTTESLSQDNKKFQEFMSYNKLFIVIASGVCIGLATKDAISNLMSIVILPFLEFISIVSFLKSRGIGKSIKLNPYISAILSGLGNIFIIFSTWMLILYLTYIAFEKLIKINIFGKELDIVKKIVGSNTEGSTAHKS